MKIRRGDTVLVIAGKDRGKTGPVERVIPERNRLVVTGVNKIRKRVKKSQRTPVAGTVEMFAPIDASNVMVVCGSCGKPTRISHRLEGSSKVRVCRRCKAKIGQS